jgi:serine/threonine protein kinase
MMTLTDARQIDGLEYLHIKGIVHRDIRPESIFLNASGVAKIGNFRFAGRVGSLPDHAAGTTDEEYMAPEVFDSVCGLLESQTRFA